MNRGCKQARKKGHRFESCPGEGAIYSFLFNLTPGNEWAPRQPSENAALSHCPNRQYENVDMYNLRRIKTKIIHD